MFLNLQHGFAGRHTCKNMEVQMSDLTKSTKLQ